MLYNGMYGLFLPNLINFLVAIKRIVKSIFVKFFHYFDFLDSILKYGKGIGYQAPLKHEVNFLIGKQKEYFTLFDIGANVGEYSLLVAQRFPNSIIYSFEPSESAFELLIQNTKLKHQINCVKTAFGNHTKKAKLYYDELGSGMASLFSRNLVERGLNFDQSEIVDVIKLDDWVEKNKVTPDFIKIDVEGSELAVLQGGIKTISKVRAVQFEFGGTAIDAKTYFKDYWNFFSELNFELYRYTPRGLLKIEVYSEKEELFEFMNYIGLPAK